MRLDKHVLPALGLHALRDLKTPVLRDWLAMRAAGGLSKSMVGQLLFILGGIFSLAVEDGVVAANPTIGLAKRLGLGGYRSEGGGEIFAMTAEQLARFLETVRTWRPDHYLDVYTLAMTGLRVGELYGLQWQDVDWDARKVRVDRQFHHDGRIAAPKTAKSRRLVDLPPRLLEMLRTQRQRRTEEDLRTGRGETPWILRAWPKTIPLHTSANTRRMLAYVMTKALRRAGLPEHFSPHSLRHTYATLHMARGESPKYVQEQLGHESIRMTVDVYGRWIPTSRPLAAAALEDQIIRSA